MMKIVMRGISWSGYRVRKLEKLEKFVCSIEDKEKYVIHVRVLKQALNHGLKFKKVQRVIKFQ